LHAAGDNGLLHQMVGEISGADFFGRWRRMIDVDYLLVSRPE
jgi:hypothetical protein